MSAGVSRYPPVRAVHFLIIPKVHIATLADCTPEHEQLLGKMLLLAPRLAKEQGLDAGFKTLINTGVAAVRKFSTSTFMCLAGAIPSTQLNQKEKHHG